MQTIDNKPRDYMKLLDGKQTAQKIQLEIAQQVAIRKEEGRKVPHLAAVIVGEEGASLTYVNAKTRACDRVGFESTLIALPATVAEADLLQTIEQLNRDNAIDGFIVQLPLPSHIDERRVTLAIDAAKDVDGFHPENLGRMLLGLPCFLPATPAGILELLDRHAIDTSGKHCVVVGRSHIVGSPMSVLMARKARVGNCTVTLAHSRTKDLAAVTQTADILIVAMGKPEFLTADMVKEGAVVVDVGINRTKDATQKSGYKLLGDVKFDEVASKAAYITPVPGGVGPMTIAALLMNTLQAAEVK